MVRRRSKEEWLTHFEERLSHHEGLIDCDPQANPVKLLAFDISKSVEQRELAFKDIESIVKQLSDKGALSRARRLRDRTGLSRLDDLKSDLEKCLDTQMSLGFDHFKAWVETPGQAIVLTAHPTFLLSRPVRDLLGEIASADDEKVAQELEEYLEKLKYLQEKPPTLQEEHEDCQISLSRIQTAIDQINDLVLSAAEQKFPDQWHEITPCLVKVYSWVGYDIDGRKDISWGDALRLRLLEKSSQMDHYLHVVRRIQQHAQIKNEEAKSALDELHNKLDNAADSALDDLSLFRKDLSDKDNLVAAANHLTRKSSRRLRSTKSLYPCIEKILAHMDDPLAQRDLIKLRAKLRLFGLGTARIHFRLNARQAIDGVKAAFSIESQELDSRTLAARASQKVAEVERRQVNFASLELERNTAHQQMILTAQIHKYIDYETPIRLLIAECEDSLTPLAMLYLARLYGLDNHLDISPLFETAVGLNNGGRILSKLFATPVYKDYLKLRGICAIQTGFSDAGRFMGQIPAGLAIERLQSHFAKALQQAGLKDVTAIIFNTHGESIGRGGHPGTLSDRLDYVLSPWVKQQYTKEGIFYCHETSFQGGDGYLWFQTPRLAQASVLSLILSRHEALVDSVENDRFYSEQDFSWDIYRSISSAQDSLFEDPNYTAILGGLGQNVLPPTGSRPTKRVSGEGSTFDPRQLRAIPHNAILQQFGTLANIFYGLGQAMSIDMEKFSQLVGHSNRVQSVLKMSGVAIERSNIWILTAYGRLFDPAFWISRAISGGEHQLSQSCLTVATTLVNSQWHTKIADLANRLRLDLHDSNAFFDGVSEENEGKVTTFSCDRDLEVLHALRLAVIMKMILLATNLPLHSQNNLSRLDILVRLQSLQIDSIVEDLVAAYPDAEDDYSWTKLLQEHGENVTRSRSGYPHLAQNIINPLRRAGQLVRQISIAIAHRYDAFG